MSVKDLTFGGLNIITAGDFFQSLFHITVSYLYFTMHLPLTLNSMLSDVRKGTLRTYDTVRSLVTDLRTIEPLSFGLSLNARGIMRSGMAGNSEGSGRESSQEAIGVGQSAMSAGSICQICVVQPSPLLGRSHSIGLSLNNS